MFLGVPELVNGVILWLILVNSYNIFFKKIYQIYPAVILKVSFCLRKEFIFVWKLLANLGPGLLLFFDKPLILVNYGTYYNIEDFFITQISPLCGPPGLAIGPIALLLFKIYIFSETHFLWKVKPGVWKMILKV